MKSPSPVTGVILAGGKSSRFGSDKALYLYDDTPLIQRVYHQLKPVCTEILVSSRKEQPEYLGVPHIYDKGEHGPMGGLYCALQQASFSWVLLLACDLPHIRTATLTRLLEARNKTHPVIAAQTPDGGLHPVVACYHKALLPEVKKSLSNNQYSLYRLILSVRHIAVAVSSTDLTNLNTPP